MRINNKILVITLTILFSGIVFGQSDSSSINPNKLVLNSSFFGVQIEVVSILAINEIGLSGDFDFYSSLNKKYNFGLRVSTEYYKISDFSVGGGSTYGPYLDFSVFGRHSIRGKYFWFSPLLGISYHNSLKEESSDSKILFKWGLELKYNLYKESVGLLLKFVGSSEKNSGYGGIGISIGFY